MLSLDYAQLGLGNARPLPQYYIPFKPVQLSFSIRPYNPVWEDPAIIEREAVE
ncbi:hypothetical protein [Chitinophaga costaii]|uniref:hypothetical protein n=1 Tax=Chitinophaga costaii TaxID=1335309 RepID=UPI000B002E74|nr:hypothetical protein [Chitinophaga costaii]